MNIFNNLRAIFRDRVPVHHPLGDIVSLDVSVTEVESIPDVFEVQMELAFRQAMTCERGHIEEAKKTMTRAISETLYGDFREKLLAIELRIERLPTTWDVKQEIRAIIGSIYEDLSL